MAATTGRRIGDKHQTALFLATSLGVAITLPFTITKVAISRFNIGIKKKAETKQTPIFTRTTEPA